MAFTDNLEALKGYAANAAQSAAKKTKQLATIAKANLEIKSEEEKIKKAQIELGKVYYKDYILEEEPDEAEYLPWCDKISESLKLIDNLRTVIEMARAEEEASCDEPVDAESEPVEETPEAPAEDTAPAEAEAAPAEPAEDAPAEAAPEAPEAPAAPEA